MGSIYVANLRNDLDYTNVSEGTPADQLRTDFAFYNLISSNFPNSNASGSVTVGTGQASTDYCASVIVATLAEAYAAFVSFYDVVYDINVFGGPATTLGAGTVLKDVVNTDRFDLTPGGVIKVYAVPLVDEDTFDSNTSHWIDLTQTNSITTSPITPNYSSGTLTLTGFDYTAANNWCGPHFSYPSGPESGVASYSGYKVMVEIPISAKHPENGAINTNTSASGVYESSSATTPVKTFEIPKVVFNTIKIVRKNLNPGESAIYTITCKRKTDSGISGTNDKLHAFRVAVTRNNNFVSTEEPYVLVKMLPQGVYTVTEESTSNGWAWTSWPNANLTQLSNGVDTNMFLTDDKTFWEVTFQRTTPIPATESDEKFKVVTVTTAP